MSVPALRFSEFKGEWEETEFGEVVTFASGGTPSKSVEAYWGGDIPWISAASMHDDVISTSQRTVTELGSQNGTRIAPENTVLLLVRGSMLYNRIPAGINDRDVTFNQDVKALRPIGKEAPAFILAFLRSKESKLLSMVTGTGIGAGKLDTDDLRLMIFGQPSVPEQKKIAAFLGVVDEKLAALRARRAGLETYKRGLMQKLFSRTLRFTKPDGSAFPDWEKQKLSFYLSEPKVRNRELEFTKDDVLSVSGDAGCVNQIEHMGRSYAGVSVKDYHVVRTGDVVYTKSPLKLNPYGIIKANFGPDGVVSTLYAVYRPTKRADATFLHYYFSLDDNLNRYLRPIVRKGAKNDMKVNNSDVLGDPVLFPSRDEQLVIADALQAMDTKIAAVADQIARMEAFKKGLLQQMFV